jgi:5-methylcytosine-specific restriction endonuclease McrA
VSSAWVTAPAVHPVLGRPLPPVTVKVPAGARDWDWAGNARKRLRLVRYVLAGKGRTCHLCGLPGATTADHVVPWSHGGRNTLDNLEPAHQGCNSARRDLTLAEWFARRPVRTRDALPPSRQWFT